MACAQECPKCHKLMQPNGRTIEKGSGRVTNYFKCHHCPATYRDTQPVKNRVSAVKFCERQD